MANAFAISQAQAVQTCCSCGIAFSMPQFLQQKKIDDKTTFFCPNGHPQVFCESELDRVKRALEFEKNRRADAERRATDAGQQADRFKEQLERVGKGVCPCCRRNFTNLRRHMKTKHPELAATR